MGKESNPASGFCALRRKLLQEPLEFLKQQKHSVDKFFDVSLAALLPFPADQVHLRAKLLIGKKHRSAADKGVVGEILKAHAGKIGHPFGNRPAHPLFHRFGVGAQRFAELTDADLRDGHLLFEQIEADLQDILGALFRRNAELSEDELQLSFAGGIIRPHLLRSRGKHLADVGKLALAFNLA